MQIQALQSTQSNRIVYHLIVRMANVSDLLTNSVNDGSDLIHQYQRPLIPKKVEDFTEYLRNRIKNQSKFIIPNLIGCFLPEDGVKFEDGKLIIPDDFKFACPDGQHRLEGIKQLKDNYPTFIGDQEVGITIFECSSFEDRQQIFADINANLKPVSKAQAIEFDHTSGNASIAKDIRSKVTLFDEFSEKDLNKNQPSSKSLVTIYSITQLLDAPSDVLVQNQVQSSIQQAPYIIAFWNAVSEVLNEWRVILEWAQDTEKDKENRFKEFKRYKKETFAYHSITFKALNKLFCKLIPLAVKAKNSWWVKNDCNKSSENLKEWFKNKLQPLNDFNFWLTSDSPYIETILRETDKGKVLTLTPQTKAVNNLFNEFNTLVLGDHYEQNGQAHHEIQEAKELVTL